MKIKVQIVGQSPAFKRYMIVRDNDGIEEYWNGERWSTKNGMLYVTEQDLARDYERLEMQQVDHLPERVFEAPVVIRIRSDKPFTLQELQDYLFAATNLHLNHEKGQGVLVRRQAEFSRSIVSGHSG
jgi:hypothetical protein